MKLLSSLSLIASSHEDLKVETDAVKKLNHCLQKVQDLSEFWVKSKGPVK